jgi:hypothetical protein
MLRLRFLRTQQLAAVTKHKRFDEFLRAKAHEVAGRPSASPRPPFSDVSDDSGTPLPRLRLVEGLHWIDDEPANPAEFETDSVPAAALSVTPPFSNSTALPSRMARHVRRHKAIPRRRAVHPAAHRLSTALARPEEVPAPRTAVGPETSNCRQSWASPRCRHLRWDIV